MTDRLLNKSVRFAISRMDFVLGVKPYERVAKELCGHPCNGCKKIQMIERADYLAGEQICTLTCGIAGKNVTVQCHDNKLFKRRGKEFVEVEEVRTLRDTDQFGYSDYSIEYVPVEKKKEASEVSDVPVTSGECW